MGPAAEQLIRDYLNRLSVAARGQLGPDDRRALVSRTRELIERETGVAGTPTAIDVGRLLSGLGDPARLVSQERQRLAALRGETVEPVRPGRVARALRGDRGRARGASWHWPVQPGSRTDLQLTLLDAGAVAGEDRGAPAGANGSSKSSRQAPMGAAGTASAIPAHVAGSAEPAPTAQLPENATVQPAETTQVQPAENGTAQRPETTQVQPAENGTAQRPETTQVQPAENGTAQRPETTQVQPAENGTVQRPEKGQPADSAGGVARLQGAGSAGPALVAGAGARRTALLSWRLAAPGESPARRAGVLLARAANWSRRHKLEATAVVLLGLGGAIFPPVFLLGAAVALASQLWDYRDKWLGLAVPVLLTVIGAVAGVAAAGSAGSLGHHLHEGWVFGVVISRLAAVLGACFLAWRSAHGRRPPAAPPWSKPHNVA